MNKDEQLLDELKQLVLDNLANEQFGVGHLAKTIGLSRSHLHRKLKKLKNQSISQFIRQIRLEKALKLILEDKVTIAEISYQVGFNSSSYFHKCFHDHYGHPPSKAKYIFESQLQNRDSLTSSENHVYKSSQTAIESSVNNDSLKHAPISFKVIITAIVVLLLTGGIAFYYFNQAKTDEPIEKSIAVLPFINLSEENESQYFTDGLLEDLLGRLSLIKEIKVISRTSSDTYRERGTKKVPEIAAELGVTYIVEGSVQKYANKARITIQLIDAKHDKHIWFQTFDRDIADVFKVQSEIAVQVASGMSAVLTEQQVLDIQKNYTNNPKAFELYQLGRYYWGKRIGKEYETAIEYFEKAIAEDSSYALAYAGLGDTYFLKIWEASDSIEMKVNRYKSEDFALKALKIDPRLVEAHTVLATLYFYIDWDWGKARTIFLKALNLNSNYATLHHRYSEFLSYVDRDLEARQHINKALELDPLSYVVREVSTKLYLSRGEFHNALSEAEICEEFNKEKVLPVLYQFWANYMLKKDRAALYSLKKAKHVIKNPTFDSVLDSIYNSSGRDGLIRWLAGSLDEFTKVDCYAFLGEQDKAMDLLQVMFDQGDRMADVPYKYFATHLESNPRFVTLMQKMDLPWNPKPLD